MRPWTMETTDGFSQADLDMINAVKRTLMQGFTGEERSVDDAINNAWMAGISRDDLARTAMQRLIA